MGSGFLAEGDAQKLAAFLKISEEDCKKKYLEEVQLFNKIMYRPKIKRQRLFGKKPYGQCIFFDRNKGCTVHAAKPLQCKVAMGCKEYGEELMIWFMLNHIIDVDDPESIRQYAAYLKTGGKTLSGGTLEELVPDKEKLKKILEYLGTAGNVSTDF